MTPRNVRDIQDSIILCRACSLRSEACTPVPGEGNPRSGIVILGRNPGVREDLEGRPFVGPAGRVLDEVFLPTAGLKRGSVWVDNLVHCHTIGDTEPSMDTVQTCSREFLLPLLAVIRPLLVVALGSLVTFAMTGSSAVSAVRGNVLYNRRGFYVIPCFHPGSSLYDDSKRDGVREDALRVLAFLSRKNEYIRELINKRSAEGGT